MKQFNGFKAERQAPAEALPAGGYVGKIVGAKVEEYEWGSKLVIAFDVTEGEHKDHYDKIYKAAGDNAKWKGCYRLTIPQEGKEYFDTQRKIFGGAIWAIEESNTGYRWDWDEKKLKGKAVGIIMRNFEYDFDGKTGWSTECAWFDSVENIRNNKFTVPKDRALKKKPEAKPKEETLSITSFSDDDLPF